MSWYICKFCGYKPGLPIKRMLIWYDQYACVECFIKQLNASKTTVTSNDTLNNDKTRQEAYNSLPEASDKQVSSKNSPSLQGSGGNLKE